MNKKLYSHRTILHYLSHMDLLPLGQLLDPEIRRLKALHKLFYPLNFKRDLLFVYKPLKIHRRKIIIHFAL